MCTGLGVVIMENKKGAKRIISLVLSAAMLLSIFISPETFADTYIDEDGYTIEDPIKGNTIEYTDPATDEKGNYPTSNDGNVYEDITVVNPDTGVTSPSLSGIGEDPISQNRTMEYNDVWLTKYIKEVDKQGKSEINLRVEAHEFNRPMDIVLVIDNSNSMSVKDENGVSRVKATNQAAKAFIDQFKGFSGSDKVGIALVTYGLDIFDGKRIFTSYMSGDYFWDSTDTHYNVENGETKDFADHEYPNSIYKYWARQDLFKEYPAGYSLNKNHTEYKFQYSDEEKENLKQLIPEKVPKERGMLEAGGTFTQKALMEAQRIIDDIKDTRPDSRKIVVLLTDGAPTFAYKVDKTRDGDNEIIDYSNPSNVLYDNKVASSFKGDIGEVYNRNNYTDHISGNGEKLHLERESLNLQEQRLQKE